MVCVPKAYSLLTMHSPPFSKEAPSWRRKKFTWRPNYALLQLIQLNRIGSRRSCASRSSGGKGRKASLAKRMLFLRCDTVRAQVTRVMNRNWSLLLIIEMISELKENRWRGICYEWNVIVRFSFGWNRIPFLSFRVYYYDFKIHFRVDHPFPFFYSFISLDKALIKK